MLVAPDDRYDYGEDRWIDPDLLGWFRSQGEYEQRMLAALRIYAQAHKDMGFRSRI